MILSLNPHIKKLIALVDGIIFVGKARAVLKASAKDYSPPPPQIYAMTHMKYMVNKLDFMYNYSIFCIFHRHNSIHI